MLKDKKKTALWALSIYICFVFIQSTFFKFSDAPETIHIFSTIDQWASDSFGLSGLFVPPGIFSAYVVGSAELVASLALLLGLFLKKEMLTAFGALLSLGVITGAIFFHLATPLGINVQGDGGTLFFMACGVWASSVALLALKKDAICACLCRSSK